MRALIVVMDGTICACLRKKGFAAGAAAPEDEAGSRCSQTYEEQIETITHMVAAVSHPILDLKTVCSCSALRYWGKAPRKICRTVARSHLLHSTQAVAVTENVLFRETPLRLLFRAFGPTTSPLLKWISRIYFLPVRVVSASGSP